jgi:hypothetical protein
MKTELNPFYLVVAEAAKEEVDEHGKFLKDDVIDRAGFGAYQQKVASVIQWPVVREMVEKTTGRLVPVVDGDSQWDPDVHPEKFLPGRHRKTAGYALPSSLSPVVAGEYLRRQMASAQGWHKRVTAIAMTYQHQGIAIGFTPGTLPVLELPQPVAAE